MSTLIQLLPAIDENYLIGIANKGLVNRANKELESTDINISLTDSVIEAVFGDGTTVSIKDTPTNHTCTCTSRTICKHVIMALLKATEILKGLPQKTTQSAPSYNYLQDHTQESLIKDHGKKTYDNALHSAQTTHPYSIEEAPKLTITLLEGAITVTFLPGSNLAEALCSCKAKNCHHRVEALFHYIKYKTGELNFSPSQTDTTVDLSIIPHALALVEDIYRIGLFRLPPEYSTKCAQYATLCHGAGFQTLERLFENSGNQLDLYEKKNAAFNINTLIHHLGRIYQICSAQNASALAGQFKRQYLSLPTIRVLGLGAYPWHTGSGFCGVTAVFYSPELKRHLTFAISRPVDNKKQALKNINQFWQDKSVWGLHMSLDEISKGELSLNGAKISDNGRLSSSESTKGNLISAHTDISELAIDDFSQIKGLFNHEDDYRGVYAILKPVRIEEGKFDRITQEYKLPIYDKNDKCLFLTIPYSTINESILYHCEVIKTQPEAITVRLTVSQERFDILVSPIAFWTKEGIKNIGREQLSVDGKKRKSYFAKFFGGAV
ncbi:MAG: SWIM zinc finger family protein [Defluviitaleaceae bacterium]|nr:SWIM zinc finger family protein [Defluviitaleaceae bacterium]